MGKNVFWLICLTFVLLSSCSKSQKVDGLRGTVDEIVSGNTIKLANGLEVKLIGVSDNSNAKEYMEQHYLHKRVRLTPDSEDKRSQTFKNASKSKVRAYVKVIEDGTCLNYHLLETKRAKIDTGYLNDSIDWKDRIDRALPSTLTIEQIASIARPATFLILIPDEDGIGQGTGFFINDKGLALTNNHVYNPSTKYQGRIYMYDAEGKLKPDCERTLGRIIYTNKDYDFTIFQVNDINEPVPCLSLANRKIDTGEQIVAVGNPKVLTSSQYDFNTQSLVLAGRVTKFDEAQNRIYHDANIDHGCSGGPVVDIHGQVVSLVTLGLGGVLTTTNLNSGADIRIIREALNHFDLEYAGK